MNKPIAVGFTIFLTKLQLTFDDFSWKNKKSEMQNIFVF